MHSEWKGSDNAAFTQTAGDWYTDADRDKGTLLLLVPCVFGVRRVRVMPVQAS